MPQQILYYYKLVFLNEFSCSTHFLGLAERPVVCISKSKWLPATFSMISIQKIVSEWTGKMGLSVQKAFWFKNIQKLQQKYRAAYVNKKGGEGCTAQRSGAKRRIKPRRKDKLWTDTQWPEPQQGTARHSIGILNILRWTNFYLFLKWEVHSFWKEVTSVSKEEGDWDEQRSLVKFFGLLSFAQTPFTFIISRQPLMFHQTSCKSSHVCQ